jgi:2-isopropylmalate synthase
MRIRHHVQHDLEKGSSARAVSYVAVETTDGRVVFGVGIDRHIGRSALRALVSAVNRSGLLKAGGPDTSMNADGRPRYNRRHG